MVIVGRTAFVYLSGMFSYCVDGFIFVIAEPGK